MLWPELVEIDGNLHEHGDSNREFGGIEADHSAVHHLLETGANAAEWMIELWAVEDRVRQIGERVPRSARGES